MSCQAALALTSPTYERPPKTLEAQENRTCSDCCTTAHSGAWGAFFTATWSHMYTCSYVCMYIRVFGELPWNLSRTMLHVWYVQLSVFHYVCMYVCMYVRMYVTVRFFRQDSNKPM